jgi:endoglucanase
MNTSVRSLHVLIVTILAHYLLIAGVARGEEKDAFSYNRLLGRGMNLGNALEASKEGDWGLTLEGDYFEKIKEAGFNSVRIPIRWSTHARREPPFSIDSGFLKRIDWVVDQALSRGLAIAINFHHYESMDKNPDKELTRFVALWKQVAERYRERPEGLLFEIMNEPHDKLTDERWQKVFPKALEVIRQSNPRRAVIIGPASWNNLYHLDKLHLPEQDRFLIATFHYYSPSEFTHQGAPWSPGSKKWLGTTWTDTPKQRQALEKEFDRVATWAEKHRRPIYLGEFGAFERADMASRARWTRAVARAAETRGFSWAYWEFGAGFGAYDRQAHAWRKQLLRALLKVENSP